MTFPITRSSFFVVLGSISPTFVRFLTDWELTERHSNLANGKHCLAKINLRVLRHNFEWNNVGEIGRHAHQPRKTFLCDIAYTSWLTISHTKVELTGWIVAIRYVLMAEAVGHGFKSRLQPETFHVGTNFLSSSTSTFLSFCGDPTGCDNN